jgi:hypothetical protein
MDSSHNIQPKPSQAVPLWLAVIALVLVVLFLEMHGNSVTSYNLLIEGNRESEGADVFVDGQRAGRLDSQPQMGMTQIACRLSLANGTHTIAVKKSGLKDFAADVAMHGAGYLFVNLSNEKH